MLAIVLLLPPLRAIAGGEPGPFVPFGDPAKLVADHAELHERAPLELPTVVPGSFLAVADDVRKTPGDTVGGREEPVDREPPAFEAIPPPEPTRVKIPTKPSDLPPPPADSAVPGCVVDDREQPLTLAEVLESVRLHYPLLIAAERERGVASGKLTSSLGAFDTNVAMQGTSLSPGTYENYRSDFGLSQLLPTGGISVFGGFRTGYGDFATYNLQQKTADAGEWRGGMTVPLARDRDIDRARAARAQAELDVSIAEPMIERSRLDYMRSAARSYWTWLGSGERLDAADELVELAIDRDKQLALKVSGGVVANIERVDNQQNVALRQALVVQADRSVQQSVIDLSLFHRDAAGKPMLASRRRMQPIAQPAPLQPSLFEESLSRALATRPEFQRLSLQREKLIVDRRLAVNNTLPGVDGQILGNQDVGYGKSPLSGPFGLDRQVLQAQLVFQMPAQRRDARGKIQTADSQIIQVDRQLQFAGDRIRAEVQDAYSALERAYEFHKQAVQRLELAKLVARAEREQLRLGRSDVLRVTLREQAKFEAQIYEIGARQEYWRAESELRAADTSLSPETATLATDRVIELPQP